jgi:hypothetical protein
LINSATDKELKRLQALFGGLMGEADKQQAIDLTIKGSAPVIEVDDDDFDIVKIMSDATDPDTGLMRDLKIDDRDLEQASSFYDYTQRLIINENKPPWLIQMWTGLMLFGEVCPVCSDKRWLDLDWVVENVDKSMPSKDIKQGLKILRHGVCPKCKRTKGELIANHGLNNYVELVNVLGQRSGKSSSAAGGYATYSLHRWLKFPRLADLTSSMQASTELTGTFVALTASRATTLWTPFINVINDSQWFKDYHAMLKHHEQKYGIEIYRQRTEYFKYFHKGLKFYFSGPRADTLRGDTRILALIDELGLFPLPDAEEEEAHDKRANADEAHKSLVSSLTTAQAAQVQLLKQGINCPSALFMGVSSPMSIRDKVMRRLADSRTEVGKKVILGINLPTWKVNPSLERTSPIIELAYATNREKAERDFGANPPLIHNTFIKHTQVPHDLFTQKNTHELTYCYDQPGYLYGKVTSTYTPKYPSILCLDAGSSNNSFTLVGAHFDFEKQKTVVSTMIEIMTHDGRKIDFNLVYTNIILPVLKAINGVALFADQWQSLDILSRAKEDMGLVPRAGVPKPRCITMQYSPKRRDFDSLVSSLENKSTVLPFLAINDYEDVLNTQINYKTLNGKPVKHLLLQILTVKDGGVGKCPEKGDGYTDDIFRALVLTTLIHKEKVMERLKEARSWSGTGVRAEMPMPVFLPRSF